MPTTDLSSIHVPRVPPDLLDRMVTEARKRKDAYKAGLAAWLVFDADGVVTQDAACGYACNMTIRGGAYVFGYQTQATPDDPVYRRFYCWLLRRSWMAPFVNSPDHDFARDIGFVLSGDLPANFLVGALTLQRSWKEHSPRVLIWDELVMNYEVPEDLAFLCAFSFHSGDDWPGINNNHNSISPSEPTYWHNFVNRRVCQVNEPFVTGASYEGIAAMWGSSMGSTVDWDFPQRLIDSVAVAADMDSVVIPNPFKPVVTKQTILSKQLLINKLLPRLVEVYGQKVDTKAPSPMPFVVNS